MRSFNSNSLLPPIQRLIGVVMVLSVLLPGAPCCGQATVAPHARDHHHIHSLRTSIDDRVRVMAKALGLNEVQQSAIKRILERRQQQMWRIRRGLSNSGAARIDAFRALQERTVEQIRAVLNEEQRKKYDPNVTRRLPPSQGEKSVEDWLTATQK